MLNKLDAEPICSSGAAYSFQEPMAKKDSSKSTSSKSSSRPKRSTKPSTRSTKSSPRSTGSKSTAKNQRGGTGSSRSSSGAKSSAKKSTPRSTASKSSSTRSRSSAKGSGAKSSAAKRTASRRQQKAPQPTFALSSYQKALIVGIVIIFFTAILFLTLLSPNQGNLTSMLSSALWVTFGWGGVLVPFIMGGVGVYLVLWGMEQPPNLNPYRLIGGAIAFFSFEAVATIFVQLRDNGISDIWLIASAGSGGGRIGAFLTWLAASAVGELGGAFLYLLLALIGCIMLSGISRQDMGLWLRNVAESSAREQDEAAPKRDRGRNIPSNPAPINRTRLREVEPVQPVGVAEDAVFSRSANVNEAEAPPVEVVPGEEQRIEEIRERRRAMREAQEKKAAPPKRAKRPAEVKQPTAPAMIEGNRAEGEWELPVTSDLLNLGSSPESAEELIQEQWYVIEHTLESFGAPGRIIDVNTGPTVTQFGVEPQYLESRSGRRTKVKVSKIAGLADDLALALAAKSVRIQAPVPGKGYIGIEVPNSAKVVVSLRDVMESANYSKIRSPLRIGLGQDVAGVPIAADLAKMPHLLIAGATGSGKSVCVNAIIACLLLQNTPDDLRFVMVDPKRVELTGYNGIPHLAAPVVVEMDRVVGVLQWALREMDQRYQAFATNGTRNINSYNKKAVKDGREKLPYIVIIIDELADLMMTAPEDTERALARLAQMARATGIHMIIATQRPSVDVVTGLIKANFPARIAFAVSSSTDSRVILDATGAERLLGAGDMLLQKPDAPGPMRMQGCYVSDDELNHLIAYWKTARRFHRYTEADAEPKPAATPTPVVTPPAPTPPPSAETEQPAVLRPKVARKPRAPKPRPKPQIIDQPAEPPVSAQLPPAVRPMSPPAPEEPRHLEPAQVQQPLWDHLIAEEKRKEENDVDELWEESIAFVRKSGKASTSMLQRRFRIGYTRAARIIDAMEDRGVIGPPTGTSKAREVMASD